MDFWYSTTLGGLDCFKAAEYYIKKIDRGVTGAAAQIGIDKHRLIEEYLRPVMNFDGTIYENYKIWELRQDLLDIIEAEGEITHLEFEVKLEQENFRCKGIVDAYTKNGWILDWKFPGKPWDNYKREKYVDSQGVVYPWLLKQLGYDVKGLKFIVCPEDGSAIEVVVVPYDEEWIEKNMRRHKTRYRLLKNGMENDMMVPSPQMMRCRFCNWRKICEFKM